MGERVSSPSIGFSKGVKVTSPSRSFGPSPRISSGFKSLESFGSKFNYGSAPKMGGFPKAELGGFKRIGAPRSPAISGFRTESRAVFTIGERKFANRIGKLEAKAQRSPTLSKAMAQVRELPLKSKISNPDARHFTRSRVAGANPDSRAIAALRAPQRMALERTPRLNGRVETKGKGIQGARVDRLRPRGPVQPQVEAVKPEIRYAKGIQGARVEKRTSRAQLAKPEVRYNKGIQGARVARAERGQIDFKNTQPPVADPIRQPVEARAAASVRRVDKPGVTSRIEPRTVRTVDSGKFRETQTNRAQQARRTRSTQARVIPAAAPENHTAHVPGRRSEVRVATSQAQEQADLKPQTAARRIVRSRGRNHSEYAQPRVLASLNHQDTVLYQRFIQARSGTKSHSITVVSERTQLVPNVLREGSVIRTQAEEVVSTKQSTEIRTKAEPQVLPEAQEQLSKAKFEEMKNLYLKLQKAYGEKRAQELVTQFAQTQKLNLTQQELVALTQSSADAEQIVEKLDGVDQRQVALMHEEEERQTKIKIYYPQVDMRAQLGVARAFGKALEQAYANKDFATGEEIVSRLGEETDDQRSQVIEGVPIRDGSRETKKAVIKEVGELPQDEMESVVEAVTERYEAVMLEPQIVTKVVPHETLERVLRGNKRVRIDEGPAIIVNPRLLQLVA